MQLRIFSYFLLAILLTSCNHTPPPAPHGPLPSERQLAWHDLEYYAFIHFNMNTFTNMEWGMGDEKPESFNPTELDTRQWARVIKEAGMKGIIITAKHHDGFCLWPSAYTEHSVKNSPWRDGKGDLLKELSEACREYDLKFGVYLSPWDRNHADYGKPEYLDYFRNQLRELLTSYGEVFEVWFDGANGGTGYYGGANENRKIDNRTYYEWPTVFEIVRELQPMACIFSDGGPDVRWVGNEEGWARPTNWSLLKRDDFAPGIAENLEHLRAGQEDGTHWLPAEVDVSIRPGWYYHPYEDHKVKTLPQLLDIYYHSVGRNASLLLNFPVDTRGLIHETDVDAVMKLAEALKADFAVNLAAGQKITASQVRGNNRNFRPSNVTDNNPETYWTTDDGVTDATLTIEFKEPTTFNRLLVQEYIPLGQRVRKFRAEAMVDGQWQTLAEETTIGYKRILRLPTVTATQVRLHIEDAKACPVISNLQLFHAPKVLEAPLVRRNQHGEVTLIASDSGTEVYYTTDGSNPGASTEKYSGPVEFARKGTLMAVAIDPLSGDSSPVTRQEFDIPATNWKLMGEPGKNQRASAPFDGNPATALVINQTLPVDFAIDLGEVVTLKGFNYLPDQSRYSAGVIRNFEFSVSQDGRNFGQPVAAGEFGNIANSQVWQRITFDPVQARYIRLRAIEVVAGDGRAGIAGFDLITGE
jgi:alpha-L-fucosidase